MCAELSKLYLLSDRVFFFPKGGFERIVPNGFFLYRPQTARIEVSKGVWYINLSDSLKIIWKNIFIRMEYSIWGMSNFKNMG